MKFKRTTAEHQYIHVHVAMVEEHDELPSYPAEKTPVVGEEPVKAPVATVSRVKTSASADDIMLPVVSLPSVPRYDTDPTLLIYHALQAPHCLSSVFHMRQRCLCASAPFPLAPSSRRGVWMPPLPLLCMSRSTRVPSHHRLSFAPPPLAFDQGDTKTGSIVTQQPAVTFAALILLQQLKGHFPSARGSSGHWFSLYTPDTASSFSNTTSPVSSRSHDPNATIRLALDEDSADLSPPH